MKISVEADRRDQLEAEGQDWGAEDGGCRCRQKKTGLPSPPPTAAAATSTSTATAPVVFRNCEVSNCLPEQPDWADLPCWRWQPRNWQISAVWGPPSSLPKGHQRSQRKGSSSWAEFSGNLQLQCEHPVSFVDRGKNEPQIRFVHWSERFCFMGFAVD